MIHNMMGVKRLKDYLCDAKPISELNPKKSILSSLDRSKNDNRSSPLLEEESLENCIH